MLNFSIYTTLVLSLNIRGMIGNKYCFEPNTQYKYMYTYEKHI